MQTNMIEVCLLRLDDTHILERGSSIWFYILNLGHCCCGGAFVHNHNHYCLVVCENLSTDPLINVVFEGYTFSCFGKKQIIYDLS